MIAVQAVSLSVVVEFPMRHTRDAHEDGLSDFGSQMVCERLVQPGCTRRRSVHRRIIRELMAYLAGQGRRVSESIAIKAALRMAKPGNELLIAHEEAAAQDQRFKGR